VDTGRLWPLIKKQMKIGRIKLPVPDDMIPHFQDSGLSELQTNLIKTVKCTFRPIEIERTVYD
jgi:hypothetical protein